MCYYLASDIDTPMYVTADVNVRDCKFGIIVTYIN